MIGRELYAELRPLAFSIAYRVLGSVAEAEDAVQEAFLRLHEALTCETRIESPRSYLSTIVTRIATDHLRRARVRREQYVGEWLPEPLLEGPLPAAEHAETAGSLSLALLVLLETLSPVQTAVFLSTTSSTTTTPRSRQSSARAKRTAASLPRGHVDMSMSAARGSRRRASNAKSSRSASSTPSSAATRKD